MATVFNLFSLINNMSEPETVIPSKNTRSTDWFVRGILTKLGEIFDGFTGRNWQPSSSLATSQLIEKLKILLDAEVRNLGAKGKYAPHIINLKMQWDKFSADAENALKKLEIELHAAAVDFINERHYYTFAPIQIKVEPDYFTEGVKLSAGFGEFAEHQERDEPEMNITVGDLQNVVLAAPETKTFQPPPTIFTASFTINNQPKTVELRFAPKERKTVGRTKESDLRLDDPSVSKLHAALVFTSENQLLVADTGSTNGTFIGSERIAYGKALPIKSSEKLKFGTVEVSLIRLSNEASENNSANELISDENFAANKGFNANENAPLQNEYATNVDYAANADFSTKADFSTNVNFSNKEIAAVGENTPEKYTSNSMVKDLNVTNQEIQPEISSTEENE